MNIKLIVCKLNKKLQNTNSNVGILKPICTNYIHCDLNGYACVDRYDIKDHILQVTQNLFELNL